MGNYEKGFSDGHLKGLMQAYDSLRPGFDAYLAKCPMDQERRSYIQSAIDGLMHVAWNAINSNRPDMKTTEAEQLAALDYIRGEALWDYTDWGSVSKKERKALFNSMLRALYNIYKEATRITERRQHESSPAENCAWSWCNKAIQWEFVATRLYKALLKYPRRENQSALDMYNKNKED